MWCYKTSIILEQRYDKKWRTSCQMTRKLNLNFYTKTQIQFSRTRTSNLTHFTIDETLSLESPIIKSRHVYPSMCLYVHYSWFFWNFDDFGWIIESEQKTGPVFSVLQKKSTYDEGLFRHQNVQDGIFYSKENLEKELGAKFNTHTRLLKSMCTFSKSMLWIKSIFLLKEPYHTEILQKPPPLINAK